jgi:hypothetical protein
MLLVLSPRLLSRNMRAADFPDRPAPGLPGVGKRRSAFGPAAGCPKAATIDCRFGKADAAVPGERPRVINEEISAAAAAFGAERDVQ